MGIGERAARLLREAPDEAVAVEHDGTQWTWGRLRRCAEAVGDAVRGAGIEPGARVGLVLENRPEHVAAFAALLAGGWCAVVVDPLQPARRLREDLERAEVPVVIGAAERLADAPGVIALGRDGSARLRGAPAETKAEDSDAAFEMSTSGTTGTPKRIAIRHRQVDRALASASRPSGTDALLLPSASVIASPLAHIGGLWGLVHALHTGRRIVLMTKFAVEPWVAAVERHRVRAAFLVPAALRDILASEVPPERLRSLKLVTSGSTVLPAELADRFFRRYGVRVLMTYGATEFAGAVAGWTYALHEQWWDRKAGSAGRAYPGVQLRVTDDLGREVPPNCAGRLEVRTAQSSHGAQDWVRTSDLARIDEDGFLWSMGRADDVISRGGFTVRPDTVERALERHPAVREAAVTGVPDERLGAVPVAAVELERGQPPPAAEELIAWCRKELLPYELPERVVLVDALPRTASAKVSRVALAELVRAAPPDETPIPDDTEGSRHEHDFAPSPDGAARVHREHRHRGRLAAGD
ncbi:class I adenylate-forming enzyme family protein [Amycolatopsis sp. WGS_07]|uniref:class I adenylate-forming enzyme family protein n=1 Tax=Amycolatopsis sp. WGS_07 TaxID=3076764 RepID=UPI003873C8A5